LCYLTHTTEAAHDVIRDNLHRSPMYAGVIEGIGPRYCPSIEDKVVRFPDKSSHQIFIEPEGLNHPEYYLNGISTSLPADVQKQVLEAIPGFEHAVIARPGYAVEYDFFPPDQLLRTMESKYISGLYFAGQVNGTSGYEEAAAQGFVAGVNAVLKLRDEAPFAVGRDEAYIGVMLDDLTTKEIDEPYRMFTSRAEFRLLLRQDNADERLMDRGVGLGLIDPAALARVHARMENVQETVTWLSAHTFPIAAARAVFAEDGLQPVEKNASFQQVLKRPGVTLASLRAIPGAAIPGNPELDERVASTVKYEGYIARQAHDIRMVRELDARIIPAGFDYDGISGLSTEAKQKLTEKRPETVGQASRIAGVRAADLSIVAVHLERWRRSHNADEAQTA